MNLATILQSIYYLHCIELKSQIHSGKYIGDKFFVQDASFVLREEVVEVGGHLVEGKVGHPGQAGGGAAVEGHDHVQGSHQPLELRYLHQLVECLEFPDEYVELFGRVFLPCTPHKSCKHVERCLDGVTLRRNSVLANIMNGIIRLLASDGDGFPYLVEMFVVNVTTAENIRRLYGNSKYFF